MVVIKSLFIKTNDSIRYVKWKSLGNNFEERIDEYINMVSGANILATKFKYINLDIKPDNMMINKEGNIKFIDMGMLE